MAIRRLRLPTLPIALLCVACLGVAACSKPEPPPTERPPEPTVARDTQLRDAIQRPIDRARAVEPQVLDAAARNKAQVDAQAGE